ncbi:MAG: hypothetical protein JZD40_02635 [Sulfolobus sp.]|nr:hypothetical protein [Sulfolobus sp.]
MEKTFLLKILCLTEFHSAYLIFHFGFMLVSVLLTGTIMVLRRDIMAPVAIVFLFYLVSFITLIGILFSEIHNFMIRKDSVIVRNLIGSVRHEFRLRDKNLILGINVGSPLGHIAILYSDKLLLKCIASGKSIKMVQSTILSLGYRSGGDYKVCRVCGSINDLEAKSCEVCGSKDLSIYELLWID